MNSCRQLLILAKSAFVVVNFVVAQNVSGGVTLNISNEANITLGLGMRVEMSNIDKEITGEADDSFDFDVPTARIYTSGNIMKDIGFELNTEYNSDGEVDILDAVIKYKVNELFQVWAGRFLPPSDRSNLSGPYYLNAWDYPVVVATNNLPSIISGRDEGLAVWGQTGGGRFKYQVGAFEGVDENAAGEDSNLFAGRLVFNAWDPEPGYYNSSTYYGEKNILAFGVTVQSQTDATGPSVDNTGDFTGMYLDTLFEKPLDNGDVVTLEGAYYDYDYDDLGTVQGDGYFLLGSYLFASAGRDQGGWQPMVRFQRFEGDGPASANDQTDRLDIGLNYILRTHNARFSLLWANQETDPQTGSSVEGDIVKIGFQVQL